LCLRSLDYICSRKTTSIINMKKILILLLVVPFWFSCQNDKPETDPVKDSLTNETNKLSGINSSQAASLDSFFRAMNDIQSNLDEIKKKEKMISKDTASGDVSGRKQQITNDIQAIYDMMVLNKQRLATAKKNLKNSNLQIASMQTTIDNLTVQLAEKEQEVTDLKNNLEKMNLELSNLSMNYSELQTESDAKTVVINTAYYAFGTSKELIKKGVLTKEGGFIGLGKSQKLSETMDKEYFTQIDITTTKEIQLSAKKAKLATTHPAGSYRIDGTDGRAETLVILDPDKFWSVSKYLVVVVEN
jgi:DNA repair exonuclease SbcCD ATPase subunit